MQNTWTSGSQQRPRLMSLLLPQLQAPDAGLKNGHLTICLCRNYTATANTVLLPRGPHIPSHYSLSAVTKYYSMNDQFIPEMRTLNSPQFKDYERLGVFLNRLLTGSDI